MTVRLKNKFAIVSGAGSGIGRACALALVGEGARVVLVDRRHPHRHAPSGRLLQHLSAQRLLHEISRFLPHRKWRKSRNRFRIYDGDHLNHIADRIETKVVPFFSQNLSFNP